MTSPSRATYAGLFLLALSCVALELVLTRVFSVASWYHFAFVAVSIAMFGITAGAIRAELRPAGGDAERARREALWAGPACLVAIVAAVAIPFRDPKTPLDVAVLGLTYLLQSVPFVFVGAATSHIFRAWPGHVGKLYGADLVGAALGCVLVIPLLDALDGPTAAIALGAVAALSALVFALDEKPLRPRAALVAIALFATVLANSRYHFVRLYWTKWGQPEQPHMWERWNAFSRIRVDPMWTLGPDGKSPPFVWGYAPNGPKGLRRDQLYMDIDGGAGTVLMKRTGDLADWEFLRWDITAAGHYLVPEGKVLSVGVGGGRDLLTALVFGKESATGVEINPAILEADRSKFGWFTGPLDTLPGIRLENDEARSWTARTSERFDLIVMSLTDTAAASSAGAFVLTENSLYTREAMRLFLSRLTERGAISITRWHVEKFPAEMWRLIGLGAAALKDDGVADPRAHMLCAHLARDIPGEDPGVGTLLLTRRPPTREVVDAWVAQMRRMGFVVDLAPGVAGDARFERIVRDGDAGPLGAELGIELSANTDDRPFYFHMRHLSDLVRENPRKADADLVDFHAAKVLGSLLVVTVVLGLVFIICPLVIMGRRQGGIFPRRFTWMGYFIAIGVAFMLVEISQMQRLILFLGHPIYGLSVVLFGLLVSSGLGSLSSDMALRRGRKGVLMAFLPLLALLAVFGWFVPEILARFAGASTPARIGIAVACLAPMGFLMGFPFPLGMGLGKRIPRAPLAWFYGINGAASVCASVLSMAISLSFGISAAFWTGAAVYAVAGLLLAAGASSGDQAPA